MPLDLPLDWSGTLLTDVSSADAANEELAALVRQAQQGSRDAFSALYLRFGGYVYAILVTRLGPDEAVDAAQDVFVAAWQRLGQLRDPLAFRSWLAALARNRAVDLIRRTRPFEILDDTHAAVAASPEGRLDARRALAAIGRMPAAYRETLALRFVQGCSGQEIAELTGLTPASVRVNLHRGFKLLRAELGLETS